VTVTFLFAFFFCKRRTFNKYFFLKAHKSLTKMQISVLALEREIFKTRHL